MINYLPSKIKKTLSHFFVPAKYYFSFFSLVSTVAPKETLARDLPHHQLLPESHPLHQNESSVLVPLQSLALYPPRGITSAGGYRARFCAWGYRDAQNAIP